MSMDNLRYLRCIILVALFSATEIYSQSVKEPTDANDEFVVTIDKMLSLQASSRPGEVIHIVEGKTHGFESLSLIISETKPGSGAPRMHINAKKLTFF
jgi:hypothetical protein